MASTQLALSSNKPHAHTHKQLQSRDARQPEILARNFSWPLFNSFFLGLLPTCASFCTATLDALRRPRYLAVALVGRGLVGDRKLG